MSGYSKEFIDEMKTSLLAHQSKLQQDLAGLQPHTEVGDDPDENAEEVVLDDVNRDLMARIKADLEKIATALQKIEDSSYGFDASGKMIGEDRLRVLPWADTAV